VVGEQHEWKMKVKVLRFSSLEQLDKRAILREKAVSETSQVLSELSSMQALETCYCTRESLPGLSNSRAQA